MGPRGLTRRAVRRVRERPVRIAWVPAGNRRSRIQTERRFDAMEFPGDERGTPEPGRTPKPRDIDESARETPIFRPIGARTPGNERFPGVSRPKTIYQLRRTGTPRSCRKSLMPATV